MQKNKYVFIFLSVVILLAGIFFRFYKLNLIPPGVHYDEAFNGVDAIKTAESGDFKIFYSENYGREGLHINVISFFVKIFLLLAFAALIYICVSIVKETYKKNQVQKEISDLQEKAQKINKENSQIKEKIAYLESPEYQAKEAKDKLGLQSPDENVIVVKPGIEKEVIADITEGQSLEAMPKIEELPNYKKWWNYFFKY